MRRFILGLCVLGAGHVGSAGTLSETDPLATTVTSIEQADALVRLTQRQFWQLVPPSMFRYIHTDKQVRPVVWSKEWPNELKKQMYAEMQTVNGQQYPLYTLWAVEDYNTGDLIYFNVKGNEVYRSPAPKNYNPYEYIMGLAGVDSTRELTDAQLQMSAANVGLEIQLIPEEFLSSYETALVLEADAQSMMVADTMMMTSIPMPGDEMTGGTYFPAGGGAALDYGSALYIVPQFSGTPEVDWLDLYNTDAGQDYEVYFTYNLQYLPFSTNAPYASTAWLVKTGLTGVNGVAAWNAPIVGQNGMNRSAGFFKAYSSVDSDGDGLSDIYELMMTKTDPYNPRSINGVDLDGDVDMDGDGFSNRMEYNGLGIGVYTHPRKIDSDGDGTPDHLDPWPMDAAGAVDTDLDGLPDERVGWVSTSYPPLIPDEDADNDGLSDAFELAHGFDPKDANDPGAYFYLDSDGDGLPDWQEIKLYGTNPNLADTDGDGVGDGYEIGVSRTNPNLSGDVTTAQINDYQASSGDSDGDGKPDWLEAQESTNPSDKLDFNESYN